MAKHQRSAPSASPAPTVPGRPTLAGLAALGALAAMWAVFQWGELLVSRAGGEIFCTLGATFDCRAIWDSWLASTMHELTGVPIAGWGVCWGVVALGLPLLALARPDGATGGPAWSGTVVTAAAGVASVLGFAVASYLEGFWCVTCIGTYIVVTSYAVLTFVAWRRRPAWPEPQGVGLAAIAAVAVFLVLLYPGLRTPSAPAKEQMASLRRAQAGAATTATGDASADALTRFIADLSPQFQQSLADAIEQHRNAPVVPVRAPRTLLGSPNAGIRLTEFTDALCGHCANLHTTVEELRRLLPPEALAIELRQFPLDSACNPSLPGPSHFPIRCTAAKALICVEPTGHADELSGAIFTNSRKLDEEMLYDLAAPFLPRDALAACLVAKETQSKLEDDIAWAEAHRIEGTPLVLLDGRVAASFGPFLYAMALARHNLDHPAFASLPKPRRQD